MSDESSEIIELKKQLTDLHYLMKAILFTAGGDLLITKTDFIKSMDMHFRLSQFGNTTNVYLAESKPEFIGKVLTSDKPAEAISKDC